MHQGAEGHADEVLFEFWRVGDSVRVAAIDPATNTEVSVVAPPTTGLETMQRVAARKLAYVLARRRREAERPVRGVLPIER